MDPITVVQWCEAEGARSEASVAIELPGEDWEEKHVKEVVQALSPDRKAWVIAVRPDYGTSRTYALLEWRRGVPENFQGNSVKLSDRAKFCLTHLERPGGSPSSSTQVKSVKAKVPTRSRLTIVEPELFTALGNFVAKCQKDNPTYPGNAYHKLNISFGRQPVPPEEGNFEEWLEQTTQALDEWDVPEAHKKQRIAESLKGPASEAIRNLKLSKRDCVAQDYLDILQDVFGRTEKVSDLIYQLEHTYQSEGEKLSEYMRRLDKIIHHIC
ncbi:paraneoplastic antigen Ma1 homolog [Aquarana catesbeiana]|uniref:paraneoplastic antigen Ma1 homolog n=1 Tax=Aquarana catesbeiana TaxID=8400 RepID=UPI003CC92AC2